MKNFFITASFIILFLQHVTAQAVKDSVKELEKVIIESGKLYKVNDPSATLRIKTPLLQLPQNIQVVTASVLRDQQVFDMLEGVTRNVSGAIRADSWDNFASIIMRGAAVTAFRNGMNVKMPWGPLLEDMSMVDRVEFVKGPAGFMLANGEPTGFYNIVTKKPTGITKGEVGFSLGSFDLYRTTLDLDGKLDSEGKLLYRFNLMGQLKNSHRDFDFNNRVTVAPVFTYIFNDKTSLTAEYTYQFMRMAMLGSAYVFSPNRYGDLPRNFSLLEPNLEPTNINDHSLFLSFSHRVHPDWDLHMQLAYLRYLQQGASIWPAYPIGVESNGNLNRSVANWDAFNESRLGQAYINGVIRTRAFEHHVLAGLDMAFKSYYADFYQTFNLTGYDIYGNSVPFNIYNPVHGFVPATDLPKFDRSLPLRERGGGTLGESSGSFYAQDEISFLHNTVRVTLAGRYTKLVQHSYGTYSRDHAFTPRAGISVSLSKTAAIYALYDKSFVAQQGADSAQKPFVPVTGHNKEAGIKKDWFKGKWNTTLSVYQIIRNNVITYVPGPQLQSVQTGQTKTQGVEADIRGEIAKGLNIILNYAYTHAEVTKDEDPAKVGEPVPNSLFADHISNGWLSYRVPAGKIKGFGAAIGYQFQGGRKEGLPDYSRLDGSISWLSDPYSVALNVNNLLDQYLYMGSYFEHNNDTSSTEYNFQIEPGINFRLTIGYRF